MRNLFGVLIFLVFLVYNSETACPSNWREYDGNCYLFSESRLRYSDQEAVCASRNATIYVFHNEKQKDWVNSQLIHAVRMEFYIGLQRVNKTWTWIDNTTYDANSTKWLRNQVGNRDDARHKCATMYSYRPYQGQVHQVDCYGGQGVICVRSRDAFELCNEADGWMLVENQCMKVFKQKLAWLDANRTCSNNNGNLIRPVNGREVYALGELVPCNNKENADDNQLWTDISDVPYPGQFRYSNNMTLRWQPWVSYGRQYLTKGGTCVYANPRQNYYWDSDLCTEEKRFACTKPTGTCPDGWAQYINMCYQLVSVPQLQNSWYGAKAYCENQNTKLVTIYSAEEEGFIQTMLVSQQIQKAWLGFSGQPGSPKVFTWVDGTTLNNSNYTHWDLTYPRINKNKTDCGMIMAGKAATSWSDGYCFNTLPFICKATITTDINQKSTPAPDVHCDAGWVLYNGQCYYFGVSQNSSGLSWDDAQRFCYAASADLLTIQDADEQDFINNNILTVSSSWIGLRYRPAFNQLLWVDQTSPSFLNFFPGEPDDLGSGQDCIQIVGGRQDFTGAWDDGNCTTPQDFICKKMASPGRNTGVTPPPTTLGVYSYRCGPDWIYNSLDGFCYQVVLYHPKTFSNAQWACQQMNSNLVSIVSPREQRYLQAILSTPKYLKLSSNYWIGGSDASQEGGWSWLDGSPFAYINWHPGEPNDRNLAPSGEDCIEMVPSWSYQWNDKRCDLEQNYICKKPASPMSTTAITPTSQAIPACGSEAMISGNYSILDGDSSLSASSVRDQSHGPFNSRLYLVQNIGGSAYASTPSWSAGKSAQGEYIQAYFYNLLTVKGVITAGKPDGAEWVTKFQIKYQYDYYSKFVWYEEPPGTIKIFDANTDNTSPVTNMIQFPFEARYVRLYPLRWNNAISLRWEILGCVQEFCLSDYAISGPLIAEDLMLTASTTADPQHTAAAARLRQIHPQVPVSAWKPSPSDKNAFIQVDLGGLKIIRGITIAGNPNAQEWVTQFQVYYGTQPTLVTSYYQEPYKQVKVFDGNVNNNETVTVYFKGHFQARYIKVQPTSYHGAIAMRFDVMVCPNGCSQKALLSGKSAVQDDQLTASSSINNVKGPASSRLYSPAMAGLSDGAWEPQYNDQRQWIQADLMAMIQITAIATQGREGHDEWVKKYKIATSKDGVSFDMYSGFQRDAMIFEGNFDDSTPRKHYLTLPIVTRFIRIYPTDYHRQIALRWEVYGCPGPDSGSLIGCYADDPLNRDLSFEPYGNPGVGLWPPMCIHHCFSLGYYYAGLQNRYMCFCGNSYGKYGHANNCNQPCYGRPNFNCGGLSSNAIYTTGLTPVTKVCPPVWKGYKDKCYLLLFNTTTWLNARQDCHSMGADLATVNSQAEQDLIYTIMSNKGASDVWIGLNNRREQNYFEWISGEVTKFTNWNVDQPATGSLNENCVLINKTDGGWQDQNCEEQHQYLCMRYKQGSAQPTLPTIYPGCDSGWIGYRWSCYLFVDQTRPFTQASQACQARGAGLVQIDDRFEQAFLSSNLIGRSGRYWTDVSDLQSPGTFRNFDTRKEVMYTNWGPNRPGKNYTCVTMQTTSPAGLWIDSACGSLYGAVCEKMAMGKTSPAPPTTTPAPIPCPTNWIEINNVCYQINDVSVGHRKPYQDADHDCREQGAFLASFHNSSDFDALWRYYLLGSTGNFWMGINALTVVNNQRRYTWSDGSALNFIHWAPNQPDNYHGTEDCGEIWSGNGLWNDADCNSRRNWICKVPKGVHIRDRMSNRAPTGGPPRYTRSRFKRCTAQPNHMEYCSNFYNNLLQSLVTYSTRPPRTTASYSPTTAHYQPQTTVHNFPLTTAHYLPPTLTTYLPPTTSYYLPPTTAHNLPPTMTHYLSPTTTPYLTPTPAGECQRTMGLLNWQSYNGHCYYVQDGSGDLAKSWREARKYCSQYNADLVSITSISEQLYVQSIAANISSTGLWTGFSEIDFKYGYGWSDGSVPQFVNWNKGEPNDYAGAEDCVEMMVYNGKWNDAHCAEKKGFVCERSNVTPKPTTLAPLMTGNCPTGYRANRNKCYRVFTTPKNFTDADKDCQAQGRGLKGYHLASISNIFENAFVTTLLMNTGVEPWIGLNQHGDQEYYWIDNTEVKYTNWDRDQPGSYKGGCTEIYSEPHNAGKWSVRPCSLLKGYICATNKSPTITTPEAIPNPCPNGFKSFGPDCFQYIPNKLSWSAAQQDCRARHSFLATIAGPFEQAKMFLMINDPSVVTKSSVWIGLNDVRNTSSYTWDQPGWSVTYANWDSGQPHRAVGGGCVSSNVTGHWADIPCNTTLPYICKTTSAQPPATPPPPNGQCRSIDWISYGNKCYRFFYKRTRSYLDATLACQRERATLVSIHSSDVNDFIKNTLQSYTVQSEGIWIGLHRSPGGFEWSDLTPNNFINWDTAQPSGKNQRGNAEDCTELRSWNGKWNDLDCTELRHYVCVNQPVLDTTDLNTPGVATTIQTPSMGPTPPIISPPSPPNGKGTTGPVGPGGTTSTSKVTGPLGPIITLPSLKPYTGPTQSSRNQEQTNTKNGLSAGGIIGIVIAVVIVLALPSIGLIFWKRRNNSPNFPFGGEGIDNATYQLDQKYVKSELEQTESDS